MVKGIAKRVIVVNAPDPKLFEQAIFIVRESALAGNGVTAEQVLEEAQRVANGYIRRNTGGRKGKRELPPPVFVALGGLLASALWSIIYLLPV